MMSPNILFVFSDQHRHNVMGCAGHPLVETPTLDKLAGRGTRFTNTWCQSPICQPSRASIITGRYAHEVGVVGNTGGFDPEWPTVMKQLQKSGYETATIGKTHYHESYQEPQESGQIDMRKFSDFVGRFGWDYVVEEFDKYLHASRRLKTPYTDHLEAHGVLDDYRQQIKDVFRLTPEHWRGETSVLPQELDLTSFIADEAVSWLKKRSDEKPFFLKLAFVQPHVPLIDDPDWAAFYADADVEVPALTPAEIPNETWGKYLGVLNKHSQVETMTEDFVRSGVRHYLGMVSLVDQKLGEVIDTLSEIGQLDNTWIVYCCDHGEMLGEHRLWAKMNFYRGSVQVPLIICPPGGMPGRVEESLTELTDVTATLAEIGGADAPDGCCGHSLLPALEGKVAGRELLHSRIGHFAGIRNDRYRYTGFLGEGTDCELFDLLDDPAETRNLVNDPAMTAIISDLRTTLLDHEQSS